MVSRVSQRYLDPARLQCLDYLPLDIEVLAALVGALGLTEGTVLFIMLIRT